MIEGKMFFYCARCKKSFDIVTLNGIGKRYCNQCGVKYKYLQIDRDFMFEENKKELKINGNTK